MAFAPQLHKILVISINIGNNEWHSWVMNCDSIHPNVESHRVIKRRTSESVEAIFSPWVCIFSLGHLWRPSVFRLLYGVASENHNNIWCQKINYRRNCQFIIKAIQRSPQCGEFLWEAYQQNKHIKLSTPPATLEWSKFQTRN